MKKKFDQKTADRLTINKKMAVSNDTPGGKSAMSKINPQKPDQVKPNFGGIKFVGD